MDLTQIHYFLALARTLNFTRAAEACNVTQPALTKSIQRLEDELGGHLLLRERSLTQLTALGNTMLPLLEQAFLAAERAKELAADLKRPTASPLRIGFTPEAPTTPFEPLFHEIAARLPAFRLDIVDADNTSLFDALLHGTLDVAVITRGSDLPDRLNHWTIFTDTAVAVMPEDHALAGNGTLAPMELQTVGLIYGTPDCGVTQWLDETLAGQAAPSGIRHRTNTAGRAMDLVRSGMGVAFSTELAILPHGMRKRQLAGVASHDVDLVAVAGRPFCRAAEAFIKLARAREWHGRP